MTRFEFHRVFMGKRLTVCALLLDEGLHVSIFGGDRAHIGAVSVVSPDGKLTTTQFATHKDGFISQPWAEQLRYAGYSPVVVEAGIHYDGLNSQDIQAILDVTQEMLVQLISTLAAKKP